jgi:uncharacterized damage-inducible protein DinB
MFQYNGLPMLRLGVVAGLVAACSLQAQDNLLSKEVRGAYQSVRDNIVRSAEKMPEENYSFKPTPRVRTFGQILGHLAEEQYFFCAPVKGEQKAVDVEKTKTSKADLTAALKEAFAYCDSVYDSMTDTVALQVLKRGESERTKLRMLWGNVAHNSEHYGNLVTYLRIKGLVPPSTEGQ